MWDWNSYILFLTALLLGYAALSKYDKKRGNGISWLILGLLPFYLLLALRGRSVGIDLERYELHVYEATSLSSISLTQLLSEPLFAIVELLSNRLGGLQAFIVITSTIECIFLFFAFRNLHEKRIETRIIFLFFIAYIFIRSFNIVRNGIAWTISLCAYVNLIGNEKNQKRNYWILTLIAFLIHNSAIINILIYFICWPLKEGATNKKMIYRIIEIVSISILLFYFARSFLIDSFFLLTEERYDASHFEIREGYGLGNILYRLPFLFLIIYSFPQLKKQFGTTFFPLVMLSVFDIIIANLKYLAADFERLACFTGLAQVVLWGMIAMAQKKERGKWAHVTIFCVGMAYFTYYMYHWGVEGGAGDGIGIMPYKFW